MATADQYAQWIVDNQNLKGSEKFNIVAQAYQESKGAEPTESMPENKLFSLALDIIFVFAR